MTATLALSPFVRGVQEFQQMGLMNKAVLDATAVDIPLITLAKNPTERKERFVRQALVLLIAFVFAPLHARLLMKWFAKSIGAPSAKVNQALMQVSFKDLATGQQFQQALKAVGGQHRDVGVFPKATDALRQAVIRAKNRFLVTDLAVEGMLFATVGFIKVLFGKLISGKKQFSGEFGIVSDKTLDALYAKEGHAPQSPKKATRFKVDFKALVTMGLGLAAPMVLGGMIRRGFARANPINAMTQKVAPFFEHNYSQHTRWLKGWPMILMGALSSRP